MTAVTLSAPTTTKDFPTGTADPGFTYMVTGNLSDGTNFSLSQASGTFDLAPGTYSGVVTKLGVSSLPSAPLTLTAPQVVTLTVPDPAQAAVLTQS